MQRAEKIQLKKSIKKSEIYAEELEAAQENLHNARMDLAERKVVEMARGYKFDNRTHSSSPIKPVRRNDSAKYISAKESEQYLPQEFNIPKFKLLLDDLFKVHFKDAKSWGLDEDTDAE